MDTLGRRHWRVQETGRRRTQGGSPDLPVSGCADERVNLFFSSTRLSAGAVREQAGKQAAAGARTRCQADRGAA